MSNVIQFPKQKCEVNHVTGEMKGSPHLRQPEADDFGDRMQRIKTSLEKIHSLMEQLKQGR